MMHRRIATYGGGLLGFRPASPALCNSSFLRRPGQQCTYSAQRALRRFCSGANDVVREQMEYDIVVIGAGPAGLGAAIRAKQIAAERGADLSVCVVEKGGEVGAHILSGNIFEPRALNELIPDWKERGA